MIYPCGCIYKKELKFFAWEEDAHDKEEVFKKDEKTGSLLICDSIFELKEKLGEKFESMFCEQASEFNFDKFWLSVKNLKSGKSTSTKTCKILLDGWNFLEDLIRTIGQESDLLRLRTPTLNKIYKKLFYGNNLPAITPEGKSYNPIFKRTEIAMFRKEIKWAWNKFFPQSEFAV